MSDQSLEPQNKGCTFILGIIASCFVVAGLFFFLVRKYFGEENTHVYFFGILGVAIAVFLGRELFKKD